MKKITFLALFAIMNFVFLSGILAQSGTLDPTFDAGSGANAIILTNNIQSDGKILIGGSFTTYNGISRTRIARLNNDGSLDNSFDPGLGLDGDLQTISIQDDGKIILGGFFNTYNGTPSRGIVRVNPNGSIDTSFNPGSGVNGMLLSTAIQSDGKIIIVGSFYAYNGTPRSRIARLNTDGSLDSTFDPGSGAGAPGVIDDVVIQNDGKILIVGQFNSFNGVEMNRIARLNPDGSLDTTFDIGTGADAAVLTVILDNDEIIIGGSFNTYNGNTINSIARLQPDGTLDNSFDSGSGANGSVWSLMRQTDGKVVIGGSFTEYDGNSSNRLARLNPNGSYDTTFDIGSGANQFVSTVTQQNDGKIIVVGNFSIYNGTSINRIVRLYGETLSTINFENNFENLVILYPNPANDFFTISNIPDGSTINVMDITGKFISTYKNVPNNYLIKTTNLLDGIYIIKIEHNGFTTHKRLILNR